VCRLREVINGKRRANKMMEYLHAEGKRKTDYDNRCATIPALVKHAMKDKLFVAISDNLARKDLNEDKEIVIGLIIRSKGR